VRGVPMRASTRRSSRARSPGKGFPVLPWAKGAPMSGGSLTGCGAVHLASVTKRGPSVKDCCSYQGTDDRLFLVSALVVLVTLLATIVRGRR
jgi:hypothetical protein